MLDFNSEEQILRDEQYRILDGWIIRVARTCFERKDGNLGYTRVEFAKEIGMSTQNLWRIETGRAAISKELLRKIIEQLKIEDYDKRCPEGLSVTEIKKRILEERKKIDSSVLDYSVGEVEDD